MAEFPYVASPNKLKSLLEGIKRRSLGVPTMVNENWLKTIGYKSSNDRSMPKTLEFIGFVDSSKKPTDKWMQFRDRSKSGAVLAGSIRASYSELFQVYPDAHQRSDDELKDFFSPRSSGGEQVVTRTANTFKVLCSLADFSQNQDEEAVPEDRAPEEPTAERPQHPHDTTQSLTPTLHIDIQIHIPSDASPEQIDKIFASMAKHLYNNSADAP